MGLTPWPAGARAGASRIQGPGVSRQEEQGTQGLEGREGV